jgi:hypothetical protein
MILTKLETKPAVGSKMHSSAPMLRRDSVSMYGAHSSLGPTRHHQRVNVCNVAVAFSAGVRNGALPSVPSAKTQDFWVSSQGALILWLAFAGKIQPIYWGGPKSNLPLAVEERDGTRVL